MRENGNTMTNRPVMVSKLIRGSMKKNQGWIKSPPNNTNALNICVVGFGRSGSTLVTHMLTSVGGE